MKDLANKVMLDPTMPWRVVDVAAVDDYQLLVTFIDGKKGLFDCKPYLEKGVFKQLKEPRFFNLAHVGFETVCWPNRIDIAPERLYTDCRPVDTNEWE